MQDEYTTSYHRCHRPPPLPPPPHDDDDDHHHHHHHVKGFGLNQPNWKSPPQKVTQTLSQKTLSLYSILMYLNRDKPGVTMP